MKLHDYRRAWDRHLDRTRETETLLTDDPERFSGRYAKATVEVLLRHLDRGRLKDMTLLDYGCGTGRLARLIAPLCGKLVCADVSPAMVEECRARLGHLPNVECLLVDGTSLPPDLKPDFVYSYAAIQYFNDEADFWHTVALIDRVAPAFCLHLHNTPNEVPDPALALESKADPDFAGIECYRPSETTLRRRYPGAGYAMERHAPDVRGEDLFFYKADPARLPATRARKFMEREITFFYTDGVEFQTVQPVTEEAVRRGYRVRLTRNLREPAEIGVYCQHAPIQSRAKFSVVMLHDMAQIHCAWPAYWDVEPWSRFDVGILPGQSWAERWLSQSSKDAAWPRRGAFVLGWPKADLVYRNRTQFQEEAQHLRVALGLKHERTVLYAPSWENDGKQDEFVRAFKDLPVNLLLKQAPWSDDYPQVLANIQTMNALHRNCADNVHIVDPGVSIMHCLALADAMVSDESSVLVEALLLGVPGVAVMDWLIPDANPPRTSDVPFDFVIKTHRAGLRQAVAEVLDHLPEHRQRLERLRDYHFSHLGASSRCVMDVIDAFAEDRLPPHSSQLPLRMPSWFSRLAQRFQERIESWILHR